MMWFYKKKGFTLLELMIVVIIVGILASLAIPRFIDAANKAKTAEASSILGSIRSSQWRYYLEHDNQWTTSILLLDVDISPSQYFTYSAADNLDPAVAAYVGRAVGGAGLDTFNIDEDGNITKE